jgi:hypothetical protein
MVRVHAAFTRAPGEIARNSWTITNEEAIAQRLCAIIAPKMKKRTLARAIFGWRAKIARAAAAFFPLSSHRLPYDAWSGADAVHSKLNELFLAYSDRRLSGVRLWGRLRPRGDVFDLHGRIPRSDPRRATAHSSPALSRGSATRKTLLRLPLIAASVAAHPLRPPPALAQQLLVGRQGSLCRPSPSRIDLKYTDRSRGAYRPSAILHLRGLTLVSVLGGSATKVQVRFPTMSGSLLCMQKLPSQASALRSGTFLGADGHGTDSGGCPGTPNCGSQRLKQQSLHLPAHGPLDRIRMS